LTGAEITSNVPPDITYNSCLGGTSCSENSGLVTWNLGTLLPGEEVIVYYNLTVSSCAFNSVTFVVNRSATSPATVLSPLSLIYSVNCLTDTPTISPTATLSPTSTLSPTITFTPAITFTPTDTFSPTLTPTLTLTPTSTYSPTVTNTPTVTYTPTVTVTPTATNTPTITYTPTITFTPTVTFTPTNTPIGLHLWPNPYNPKYAYDGQLRVYQAPTNAVLSIYTVSGELVIAVDADNQGWIRWEGQNKNGSPVSGGIYYYVVQSGYNTLLKGTLLIVRN
jgi:hypothetical protein